MGSDDSAKAAMIPNGNGTIAEADEKWYYRTCQPAFTPLPSGYVFRHHLRRQRFEPELLTLQVAGHTGDASCFEFCDGTATVMAGGG